MSDAEIADQRSRALRARVLPRRRAGGLALGVVSGELSRHCQALLEELQNDRLGAEASGGWGLKARGAVQQSFRLPWNGFLSVPC